MGLCLPFNLIDLLCHSRIQDRVSTRRSQLLEYEAPFAYCLLTTPVERLTIDIHLRAFQAAVDRQERPPRYKNLIVANEVTCGLAQKVAAFQRQTTPRVIRIEQRIYYLEPKP